MALTEKLTEKKIAKLKAPGRYGDGHGLYLQVQSTTRPMREFPGSAGGAKV